MFATEPRCRPTRYVVDLKTRKLIDRQAMTYDLCSDFPAIDNRRQAAGYNDFWFLGISKCGGEGRKFFDQLAHGSWKDGSVNDTFEFAPGEYLGGEPMFVGNPKQPDEGVVIVEHLNTATDEAAFLLFDAFAVRKGPIARLPLRQRLHPGFHSSFYLENG
jgi:carotenoid cleavage dioxygenase-like enzyme